MKNTITFFTALFTLALFAQTNPVPQSLPYSENFDDLNHASEVWPAGIQGWRINNVGPSEEFFLVPAQQDRGLSGNATADDTGNDVYNFDQKIGFRSTTGGNNFIALALNTLGFENITFTYDIMTIRNLAGEDPDNWIKEVGLQYRVGTSGDFTNIPNTAYQNPSDQVQTEGTTGQDIQTISITLPEAVENQAVVQLRWVKREIAGDSGNNSRPSFAIDNLEAFGDELDLNTFYFSGTGDLNDTDNWSTNPSGMGGASPANFDNDDVLYIISNTSAVTLSSNWTVSGANSLVSVGTEDEALTLIVDAELDADLLVENAATLQLQNAFIPASITTTEGSTVVFTGEATDIPYGDFHNLTLDGIAPEFDGDGNINITGNITLIGEVNMPDARDADEYDFTFLGDFNQSIVTNGNVFRSYELNIEKTQGTFNLEGTISTDSQLSFTMSGAAMLNDNGNIIYAGNSVNIAGEEDSYNFTGTLILADFEEGIVNGAGDGNNFNIREGSNDNPVAAFQNIIVRAVNEGGQFRFRDGSTDVFKIKGDLIVESQVKGGVRFYGNSVELGGDFIVEEGFEGTFTNPISSVKFIGENAPQSFTNHAGDLELVEMEIDNANGLSLFTNLFVSNAILFIDGIIFSNADAGLYLENPNGALLASENSYVDGPLYVLVQTSNLTELIYPVGKNGAFRPVDLTITQEDFENNWYFVEVMDGTPGNFELQGLEEVSSVRYYSIGKEVNGELDDVLSDSGLTSVELTLSYGIDDNVLDASNLRIAQLQDETWISRGGTGDGVPNGNITTTEDFNTIGLFILANEEVMSVDQAIFEGLVVYPNPFKEAISIEIPPHLSEVEITIFNKQGRLITKQNASNGTHQIAIPALTSGMYILQVKSNNQVFSQKLIKN